MKLGLSVDLTDFALDEVIELVVHADRLGIDSVWCGESYGTDAVTVLSHLSAVTDQIKLGSSILQMPGRTPANTAMTALTLDGLSGGRLLLGLGLSGPQVVEGWHGVPYGSPLRRTREYVEIVRAIVARRDRLQYDGREYQIPYQGPDATRLGKPLKTILHPVRDKIPIYLASIGPKNVRLTAEIADGWLPIFYSPEREHIYREQLDAGLRESGRDEDALDVVVTAIVVRGDDIEGCRDRVRGPLALYIGGMGARGKNFYHDLACRYGFEDAANRIQDLFLDGKREEAMAEVPPELIDEVALVGPLPRMIERLEAWKSSRVGTLVLDTRDPEVLSALQGAL